jgi:gamma-glutamyltranspeptidase
MSARRAVQSAPPRGVVRVALRWRLFAQTAAVVAIGAAAALALRAASDSSGLRDPAWAPRGNRLAASWFDRIWTFAPNGQQAKPLITASQPMVQREPAWSADGSRIAFAGDSGTGFDIYITPASGGTPERVTKMSGDERWPSFTPDGRVVFAHREDAGPTGQWDLYIVTPGGDPVQLTNTPANEIQPRVSPDGRRILFVSDRDSEDRDLDVWVMKLEAESPAQERPTNGDRAGSPDGARTSATRVVRARGIDGYPAWSPSGDRVAFFAVREGVPSVWVATVDGESEGSGPNARVPRAHPAAAPILVSRHGGSPAWSPDGRTILIGELPEPEPDYNGNPDRVAAEPPPAFGGARSFKLWTVPAPEPVDASGRDLALNATPDSDRFVRAFDNVWQTLAQLYYSHGPSAAEWRALGEKYRAEAAKSSDARVFESTVDRMILEQPLIKPAVESSGAVIVSGNVLASGAGKTALEKGGNIVDAMIATSFALGVVEPDASGVGGDGQAILFLKGMSEPVVVEYKDETPIHATIDNPKIFKDGRLVADGAAAMNIPGVVAGLDYLYRHYGSGKVSWEDLIAPAIKIAEDGFVLDAALPTTVAEGRQYLEKYPEAKRIFLPGGRVLKPGDRFSNPDLAATLRAIAKGGADSFYRGELARKIAADLQANGGIIGLDDLAQYRAIERKPLEGRFRGHFVYGPAPPVSDGVRMIETLQILDNYHPRPGARFTTDPDYFHYLIESWKVRDNPRRIADPAHWAVELGDHLAPDHAAALFKKIDPKKASRSAADDNTDDEPPPGQQPRIGRGTTGFAMGDSDGNMIAVTQTLSTWGGNFYVSKGLGFLYNNHLRSSRTARGYGQMLPLSRSGTTNSPTLVFDDDNGTKRSRLAVAAAGNAWITASIYSIIANVIDGGLPAQRAVEAPRFLIGRDPMDPLGTAARIQIEDRIPRETLDDLIARGHVFQKIGRKGEVRYGYASAVVIDTKARKVEGGAEPRRSHGAVPFP